MKTFTENKTSMKKIHDIWKGFLQYEIMNGAVKLGLFNQLEEFISAKQVAEKLNYDITNTEIFLDGVCMINLVEKTNGLYKNTPEASLYLVEGKDTSLKIMLEEWKASINDVLNNIVDLVKDGARKEFDTKDISSEELWAKSAENDSAWILGGIAPIIHKIIKTLPEYPSFNKMLDLGGGSGLFCIYFVLNHPKMKGVVFDQPAVTKVAQKFVKHYGAEQRVSTFGGDYFSDSIGDGYDFIWACSSLNFAKGNLDELMKKIYNSLNPGGIFSTFQDGMTNEKTKPDTMLMHVPYALSSGYDITFDQGEIAESMLRTGFRNVHSRTVSTPLGDLDLDIARK